MSKAPRSRQDRLDRLQPAVDDRRPQGAYTFEITANEIEFRYNVLGAGFTVLLAVEEVTKCLYAEVVEATPKDAAAFLAHLVAKFPQRIIAVTTDIHPAFTDWRATFDEDMAEVSPHPFAVVCRANKMVHTSPVSPPSKILHPAMARPIRRNPVVRLRRQVI